MGGKSVVLAFPSPSIFPSHICTIFSPSHEYHSFMVDKERKKAKKKREIKHDEVKVATTARDAGATWVARA